MKIALGLFHFNIHYVAGDLALTHRYCTQAVIPFLEAVALNRRYRVSFGMAGSGLEFLSQHYRDSLALLRELIARKQVELVSSLYTPAIWPAFPKRDLVRSVELNRACLDGLGLESAGIFFSQEAFFGPGLKELSHLFAIAVCKDDYLRYVTGRDRLQPIYQLGGLRVVVGGNHLLNELRRRLLSDKANATARSFSAFHRTRLERSEKLVASSSTESTVCGSTRNVEWYWYHMGSGHQFATWAAPTDWEAFFLDESWMRLNEGIFNDLLAEGYRLGTITELVSALVAEEDPDALPAVIEAGWDPERSEGVYTWMGKQASQWENDAGILALAWRSRGALRGCEAMVEQCAGPGSRAKLSRELDNLWRQQLLAECSDPLGWAPGRSTVLFGRESAEKALQLSGKFTSKMQLRRGPGASLGPEGGLAPEQPSGRSVLVPLARAELVGPEGMIHWTEHDAATQVCEAQFRAVAPECGIRFARETDCVTYCPSGMEDEPVTVDPSVMNPADLYLPLANGLISLGEDLYLIRQNEFGQVAARVSRRNRWLTFAVSGARENKAYRWRFMVFKGSIDAAVKLANATNLV